MTLVLQIAAAFALVCIGIAALLSQFDKVSVLLDEEDVDIVDTEALIADLRDQIDAAQQLVEAHRRGHLHVLNYLDNLSRAMGPSDLSDDAAAIDIVAVEVRRIIGQTLEEAEERPWPEEAAT